MALSEIMMCLFIKCSYVCVGSLLLLLNIVDIKLMTNQLTENLCIDEHDM